MLMQIAIPTYTLCATLTNYFQTGRFPQAFQRQVWLYRHGNYCAQATYNANPDNFWDKRHYCWTTDPNCGLEIGPKRPWLDLKDPSKNLSKLQRDATRSARLDKNGYQGF